MKTATQDIVVEELLAHAPEAIWKTLTTGVLIDRWLMIYGVRARERRALHISKDARWRVGRRDPLRGA